MLIDTDQTIRTTGFGKSFLTGKWHNGRFLKHSHLLMYLETGFLKMKVGNQIISATAGDVILLPADTLYVPITAGAVHYYFFHFEAPPTDRQSIYTKLSMDTTPSVGRFVYRIVESNTIINVPTLTHCESNLAVKSIFQRISALNPWKNSNEKMLVDCLLRELLITISTELTSENSMNKHLSRILQYIAVNYQKDITLSTLSEAFDLSVSYIARLFKNEMQTTSVNYINAVRISAACDLLLNTNLSIGEISERVGFANQYYFTRVFQKHHKTTPSDFRRSGLVL